jgi:hypothetical protein
LRVSGSPTLFGKTTQWSVFASEAESQQGDFDPKDFCGADFYTAEIVIDGTPLFPVCEALFDFCNDLIDKVQAPR